MASSEFCPLKGTSREQGYTVLAQYEVLSTWFPVGFIPARMPRNERGVLIPYKQLRPSSLNRCWIMALSEMLQN